MQNVQKVSKEHLLNVHLGMLPVADDTLYVGEDIFMADNLNGEFNGDYENTLKYLPGKLQIFVCIICLEESISFTLNGKHFCIRQNDVLIIPPGVIAENVDFDDKVRLIVFAFSYNGESVLPGSRMTVRMAYRMIGTSNAIHLHLSDENTKSVREFYCAGRKLFNTVPDELLPDAIQGFIDTIACSYLGMFPQSQQDKISNRDDELLTRFIGLLNREATFNRSVTSYAGKLCVSPKYLSRVIRKVSGKKPESLIRERVILEAKALLIDRTLSIGQIADILHFPNPSFFGSYFKASTGMTPGDYRRMRRNEQRE